MVVQVLGVLVFVLDFFVHFLGNWEFRLFEFWADFSIVNIYHLTLNFGLLRRLLHLVVWVSLLNVDILLLGIGAWSEDRGRGVLV